MPDPDLAELSDSEVLTSFAVELKQNGDAPTEYYDELLNRMESAPEWIPVEEALPEEDGDYLVVNLGDLCIRHWYDGHWRDGRAPVGGNVTHWRDLPTPPDHE